MNYDLRFKAPFSLILSGVSGSGKTTWVENLLKNYNESSTMEEITETCCGSQEQNNPSYSSALKRFLMVILDLLQSYLKTCTQKLKK